MAGINSHLVRQNFPLKFTTDKNNKKILCNLVQVLSGSTNLHSNWLFMEATWTYLIHNNVHRLWHISTPDCSTGEQLQVFCRFTLKSDPEPLAAWHPVLFSADPGTGGDPLALNSGLIHR